MRFEKKVVTEGGLSPCSKLLRAAMATWLVTMSGPAVFAGTVNSSEPGAVHQVQPG